MPRFGLRRPRRAIVAAAAISTAAALALAGCSSSASDTSSSPSAGSTQAVGSVDLSKVCPANIVVQGSWYPQAETGYLFQLLKGGYKIDSAKKSVSGPLVADTGYTGVNLEVRSGGPAIGYQQAVSQLYTDNSITFALVDTDQALEQSAKFPTTGVFAPLDKSPLIVMWDPATYPKVKTIKELNKALQSSGGVVRYSQGLAYMSYLTSAGYLSKGVLDGSYDGTPANFIAAGGKDAQQGYSDNEAFTYEHEISNWMKPVAFQLVADTGWNVYPGTLSVRSGDLKKLSPCLQKLVPIFQQADVDYFKDSTAANKVVLDQVSAFKTGDIYDKATVDNADKVMLSEKMASNAGNGDVGDFDLSRLQQFFDVSKPVFEAAGSPAASGVTPNTLVTNKFIDPKIGF